MGVDTGAEPQHVATLQMTVWSDQRYAGTVHLFLPCSRLLVDLIRQVVVLGHVQGQGV